MLADGRRRASSVANHFVQGVVQQAVADWIGLLPRQQLVHDHAQRVQIATGVDTPAMTDGPQVLRRHVGQRTAYG